MIVRIVEAITVFNEVRVNGIQTLFIDLRLHVVIVLTRAASALQCHFLLFVFLVGLVVYSCVIFLLFCYGIVAQYFGFSNFGY